MGPSLSSKKKLSVPPPPRHSPDTDTMALVCATAKQLAPSYLFPGISASSADSTKYSINKVNKRFFYIGETFFL